MKNNNQPSGYGNAKIKYKDELLPWVKVICYRKDKYVVVDRYSGDQKFIGQSIYFNNKKPIFGFNYYGRVVEKSFLAKTDKLFDFLKKALRAGVGNKFRGKDGFSESGFKYYNKYKENNGFIIGNEVIKYNQKIIYRLMYHGGSMEDRRNYKQWSKKLLSSTKLYKDLNNLW
ncbi:MAG: DUF5680 domain-containing protein [Patescibacteria group bacterium]